ncbi:predicted protein [Histoplasma capsulatum G186AR]|uniref:Uncharacterized protein n=1 Tax=Ajellomyces capsulatus (strain G186AR / H82 / ATCC MYA-2454 / RMSCC 2432) TaxID=447093 RepID=C0NNZ3_AJECG|nr:uncharacterized protein HCBG_04873 [Histoplasma capsulatum G186AR]EEH06653.1 predicted protein [Histoplasma capsulatum G186AR]
MPSYIVSGTIAQKLRIGQTKDEHMRVHVSMSSAYACGTKTFFIGALANFNVQLTGGNDACKIVLAMGHIVTARILHVDPAHAHWYEIVEGNDYMLAERCPRK